jgi:hypothetical protein
MELILITLLVIAMAGIALAGNSPCKWNGEYDPEDMNK